VCSHDGLLLELNLSNLLTGGHHVLVLDTHDTSSPFASEFLVLIECHGEGLSELLEVGEVFLVDGGEGDAGSGLLVDKLTKVGLSTDEAVWDTTLSAESGEEAHHLDGVNVVGNDNELGGLLLNECGDVVESEFDVDGLGTGVGVTTSGGLKSVLLLLAGFGRVLGEELGELGGLVSIDGVSELSNGRWDLESLHKDSLLSLDSDVLGPLDESGEISLGLDIASNSEVSGALLEERVFGCATLSTGDDLLHNFLCHIE